MSDVLADELELASRVLQQTGALVPRWLVLGPEPVVVLTRYDHARPGDVERVFRLMRKMLAWKAASGFVMTAETFLGAKGDEGEAIVSYHVTRTQARLALREFQRVAGTFALGKAQHFGREAVDPVLLAVLPEQGETVSPADISVLKQMITEHHHE